MSDNDGKTTLDNEIADVFAERLNGIDINSDDFAGMVLFNVLIRGWSQRFEVVPSPQMRTGDFLKILSVLGYDIDVKEALACCTPWRLTVDLPARVDGELLWRPQHLQAVIAMKEAGCV